MSGRGVKPRKRKGIRKDKVPMLNSDFERQLYTRAIPTDSPCALHCSSNRSICASRYEAQARATESSVGCEWIDCSAASPRPLAHLLF